MEVKSFFHSKRFTETNRIIAVLVLDDPDSAVPLAEALLAGGVRCMELTLRTPNAIACLKKIRNNVPDMVAGVGTILFKEQVKEVVDSGAEFGVAPGLSPPVIEEALKLGLPFGPGITTPSDIEAALQYGFRVLKFFPAEPSGGLKYLSSMAAPYKHLKIGYIPLGGISTANLSEYLSNPYIWGIGGSWLAKADAIAAKDWAGVTERAKEASEIAERSWKD